MSTDSSEPKKGSAENPYTREEYERILESGPGNWKGGYVEGMGYVWAEIVIDEKGSSSSSKDEGSGSGPVSSDDGTSHEPKPDYNASDYDGSTNNNGSPSPGGSTPPGGGNSGNPGGGNITITGKTTGVSSYTLNLLSSLTEYSGEIRITSTTRTPEAQARAMLNNIKKTGIAAQKKLYGSDGDKVIDVYNSNLSDAENIRNMTDKINQLGPSNVSKHCTNEQNLDVFDVSAKLLSNVDDFLSALNSKGISYINESDTNGCIHIEIKY